METILTWIAVAVGAAGMAAGIAGRGWRRMRTGYADGAWLAALATAGAAVVLYLLTRMAAPPFAFGERLGYGILIGGAFGALAGVWSTGSDEQEPWKQSLTSAFSPSAALLGVGLILLIFPAYPQPVLSGYVIGGVMAAILFRFALPAAAGTELWGISSVTLGAATLLSVIRYDATDSRFWWRAPAMIVASAIIAYFLSAALAPRSRGVGLRAAAASAVTLVLAAIFAWRLFPDWSLLMVAVAGVGAFSLVIWLAYTGGGSARSSALAALVVVAFATFAFRSMAGFGIGVGMLAALPILIYVLALPRREEQNVSAAPGAVAAYAYFIGIGLLFLRLFLENYAVELRGLDLSAHYTFIALALGAMLPFVLISFFAVPSSRGVTWNLASAGAAGLFAAASPLFILVLWGFRATLGFLVGSIIAQIFLLFIQMGAVTVEERGYARSALLVLAAQIAAVQFSGLVGPLAQEPRATRALILAAVVLAGLIWAGISALLARRRTEEV